MPAQSLQLDAIVLLKQPPGDTFQTLNLFTVEHGVVLVLQRLPKKAGPGSILDLFDHASVRLETSNQGRTYFVQETRLLTRHGDIGRNYQALVLASRLATVIARNPLDEAGRPQVFALLERALAAFGRSPRPDIVYLKALYRFAREEGLPLKEEWFPTLPASDRAGLGALLNQPLEEQSAAADLVTRWQRRLEEYLRGHADFVIPE